MEKITAIGLFCTSISLFGFYMAYFYGRHTKRFRLREYFAIILFPIISVIIMIFLFSTKILSLFLMSMVVGTAAEYLFGLIYEKTLNKKLWIYNKFSIGGYTSFLSVPIWGIAGVVFWAIGKFVGL